MAERYRRNIQKRQAFLTYLEVSYLDANGPRNLLGRVDPEIMRESPPFNPSYAFQSPGVLDKIYHLSQELRIRNADLRVNYLQAASWLHKNLKTPVDPEHGWIKFEKELKEYSKNIDWIET
jgi:hypothetical protein